MRDDNIKKTIIASVVFTAGAPSFLFQSGEFTGTITDNGTGDITLNLNAADAVDASECSIVCTPRAAQAASGLTSIGVVHTSDTAKQITIVQEGAAGAASARADVNFDICINVLAVQ